MKYEASSPEEYIRQLPENRKAPMTKLHHLIINNMPEGLESGMGYGMPAYFVPKTIYPPGYHCKPFPPLPFINLVSQKNFIALYHMGLYANTELHDWFVNEYPKHCKYKLDMGKSCIRFKKMNDIPYDLLKELFQKQTPDDWIALYERNVRG